MYETKRLLEEAGTLLGQQNHISEKIKDNLIENVEYFLSLISRDSLIKNCFWEWYKDDDGEEGIGLVWDWEYFKGRFDIDIHNGYGFGFEFGTDGGAWCGGDDGKYGFHPDYDVTELKMMLHGNHLIE